MAEPPPAGPPDNARVVIKKYANRRLYNTDTSSYVTLEHLAGLVREGADFVVYDARSGEDITRQVLTQIIFEAENSDRNLLPIQFLRQLIRMYGDQIQAALAPSYLEMSLDAFARQGERLREEFDATLGRSDEGGRRAAQGYSLFEDHVRQNMALFERAMGMFTPFAYPRAEPQRPEAPGPVAEPAAKADPLDEMKARLDEMQRQIERLGSAGRPAGDAPD